jgi:hypothetical protein
MKARTTGSFVIGALVNALILVVANFHAVWRPWLRGVVTEDWVRILWSVNLVSALQVAGNLTLACHRPPFLRRFIDFALTGVSLLGAIVFLRVFPLDCSRVAGPWLGHLAHALVLLAVVATAIAAVGLAIRLVVAPRALPH